MADAMDSKSIVGDNVWVQVPPSAPKNFQSKRVESFFYLFDKSKPQGMQRNNFGKLQHVILIHK